MLNSAWEWAIVLIVLLLLFGAKRLPDTARGLGRSLRILKAETKGLRDEDPDGGRPSAGPSHAPAAVPPALPVTSAPTVGPAAAPPAAGGASPALDPSSPATAPGEPPTR